MFCLFGNVGDEIKLHTHFIVLAKPSLLFFWRNKLKVLVHISLNIFNIRITAQFSLFYG